VSTSSEVRECFAAATAGFVAVVVSIASLGDDAWDRPALGSWNVRDLVGHTTRAFSTIETYLGAPASEIRFLTPLDYLLAGRAVVDHSAVADRGREAGVALGDDPVAAVREVTERVTALVAVTADEAPLQMRFGGMTLLAYLSTRTFELTVHSLDLVSALGIDPPAILQAPLAECLSLAAAAAAASPDGATVLLALTGRRALPAGFSLV
jgi:uncharacterized protein (TIGR03083 family)